VLPTLLHIVLSRAQTFYLCDALFDSDDTLYYPFLKALLECAEHATPRLNALLLLDSLYAKRVKMRAIFLSVLRATACRSLDL
jgi:hypothetical protein